MQGGSNGCFLFTNMITFKKVNTFYLPTGSVTEQQAVMLLRCYGGLMVKISPQERAKMLDVAWQQLHELGMGSNFKNLIYDDEITPSLDSLPPTRTTCKMVLVFYVPNLRF